MIVDEAGMHTILGAIDRAKNGMCVPLGGDTLTIALQHSFSWESVSEQDSKNQSYFKIRTCLGLYIGSTVKDNTTLLVSY